MSERARKREGTEVATGEQRHEVRDLGVEDVCILLQRFFFAVR